jgi:hypothetical protein
VRHGELDDAGAWWPTARRGRGVDVSRLAVAAGWKGNNDGEGFFGDVRYGHTGKGNLSRPSGYLRWVCAGLVGPTQVHEWVKRGWVKNITFLAEMLSKLRFFGTS